MVENARNEFIQLMTQNTMSNGLDELSSRITGILFIEPREISLEEIAKKTGYSISAVSGSSKLLEKLNIIKRLKKPGSRKVFYFMEKDIFCIFIRALKMKRDKVVKPSLERLPVIIAHYKKKKVPGTADELKIVENYYCQVKAFGRILEKMLEITENAYTQHVQFKKPSKK